MHSTTVAPLVRCRAEGLETIDADMLCAPVFSPDDARGGDDDAEDLGPLDLAVGGALSRARASGECTGKLHERFLTDVIDTTWRTRRVLLVGAGPREHYDAAVARTVAATAGMAARDRAATRLVVWCPPGCQAPGITQAVVEGVLLGAFRDTRFKTRDTGTPPLRELTLALDGSVDQQDQTDAERGQRDER